jgi:hypothetical protein
MNTLGLLAILVFGLGLVTYVPHFFVIQLFLRFVVKPYTKSSRWLFIAGCTVFVSMTLVFGWQYKNAVTSIEEFKQSGYTRLEKTWMTEKILGMYFKYHTEICIYDGWRPPLHEPALVMGQWLNDSKNPMELGYWGSDLKKRVELYQLFFPNEKIKMECSCAVLRNDKYYHGAEIFKSETETGIKQKSP